MTFRRLRPRKSLEIVESRFPPFFGASSGLRREGAGLQITRKCSKLDRYAKEAGLGGNPNTFRKFTVIQLYGIGIHLSDLHGEPNFGKPLFVTNQPSFPSPSISVEGLLVTKSGFPKFGSPCKSDSSGCSNSIKLYDGKLFENAGWVAAQTGFSFCVPV